MPLRLEPRSKVVEVEGGAYWCSGFRFRFFEIEHQVLDVPVYVARTKRCKILGGAVPLIPPYRYCAPTRFFFVAQYSYNNPCKLKIAACSNRYPRA